MRSLTLFIPGLLGPEVHYSDDYLPELESLEYLLARSDHHSIDSADFHRALAVLMGLPLDPGRDVPAAAVTRAIDDHDAARGIWMRADPVHLSPDRDGLTLMDSFILRLSQHDALAIAAEVNKVLEVHDWVVQVPYEDRWYIKMEEAPDMRTRELSAVVGRDISDFMPEGTDAGVFNTLLNEIQMQLYAADINHMREARGELSVNSVWFWGLGRVPPVFQPEYDMVYADDAFARGLARLSDTTWQPFPAGLVDVLDHCPGNEGALLVMQHCQAPAQYQNLPLWHQALQLLEQNWFQPVLAALKRGEIRTVRIIAGDHEFHTGRLGMKRVWRRPVPISHYRAGQ